MGSNNCLIAIGSALRLAAAREEESAGWDEEQDFNRIKANFEAFRGACNYNKYIFDRVQETNIFMNDHKAEKNKCPYCDYKYPYNWLTNILFHHVLYHPHIDFSYTDIVALERAYPLKITRNYE